MRRSSLSEEGLVAAAETASALFLDPVYGSSNSCEARAINKSTLKKRSSAVASFLGDCVDGEGEKFLWRRLATDQNVTVDVPEEVSRETTSARMMRM